MKRFYLMLVVALCICLFAVGCGNNTTNKEQSINIQGTEQQEEIEMQEVELSELEKQIQEFKNNTSSEITITQDVLRGKWMYGNVLHFIEEDRPSENFILGNVRIKTDGNSMNSHITFSNNKFVVSYEVTEAHMVGDQDNVMQGVLVVSGLYRVIYEQEAEDEYSFDSKIELLITEISMQSEVEIAEIMDELNSVIGTTLQKSTSFMVMGAGDLSDYTEEMIAKYDMELPDTILNKSTGEWGYRADGSYGLTIKEDPNPTPYHPMTHLWIGKENGCQLFAEVVRMKTKYTVDMDGENVEQGLSLYHALTREKNIATE